MIVETISVWCIRVLIGTLLFYAGYRVWRYWGAFDRIPSILLSPLVSIVTVIVIGSPFYWLYHFGIAAIITILAALCIISIIATIPLLPIRHDFFRSLQKTVWKRKKKQKNIVSKWFWVYGGFYSLFLVIDFLLLFHGRTIDSALGPWERVNVLFFIITTISSFLLLASLYIHRTLASCHSILLACHALFLLSVLGIIFPLGYGFDPYLHRAAESLINQYGVVLPKTLYYIGQYVSVVFIHRLFSIPIFSIDIWLVPILASLSIVPLAVIAIQQWIGKKPMTSLLAVMIYVVPFSTLINTTPWSLSFLFFIISVLLSLIYIKQQRRPLLVLAWLATIASVFIHPLGGIPALIITSLTSIQYGIIPLVGNMVIKKMVTGITIIGASIITPLAFYLNGFVSTQLRVSFSVPQDISAFMLSILAMYVSYDSRYKTWQDAAYIIPHLWGLLVLLVAIGVSIYCWLQYKTHRNVMITLWSAWLAIIINFVLIKGFVEFTTIVSYERDTFAGRLYDASIIVLLPFCAIGVYSLLTRLYRASKAYPMIKLTSIIGIASLMTATLYVSYPKRDAYSPYHGYMVSAADIATVQWINQDAGDENTIILASQVLGAAAIQEFGFKKYYRREIDGSMQDIFYYPVPASSPLYAEYWDMLKTPSRQKADTIMQTYGINKLYVVVNHYEPQYQGTKNKLRAVIDEEKIIKEGNSEDTVFVFEKHP